MKKQEQKQTNSMCDTLWSEAMQELNESGIRYDDCKRLKSCQAYVYETENFFILRSYSTMIAAIDKKTDTLIDVLRGVYGYTSTSAQHIAKFGRTYGKSKYGTKNRITYRDI